MTAVEGALAVAAAIAATAPVGAYLARRDPGPLHPRTTTHRRARTAAQADRDLLRLARNARKKERPTLQPAPIAATEDEQRDPDYCWTCGRKCGSQAHR
ncbi:hypothetical protein OG864_29820 [Streptomyces sp. NBC_00124]|uniref:hypothetical protein n=1 Tax=Streptomyces sp. NBC_00124 TaxID=2975662 RepID=UPI002251A531|nr:hypothetical protein [Streptomyces sp. NBC_00124]MCX5362900.1 hypothetical protein [Streptomyces sp. NBC_00124]